MKTEEAKLKYKVKTYLDTLDPKPYWFMPVPTGYGSVTLDFLCCINGRFCGIETKGKGREATPRQKLVMDRIIAAGGVAFCCDSYQGFLIGLALNGLVQSTHETGEK